MKPLRALRKIFNQRAMRKAAATGCAIVAFSLPAQAQSPGHVTPQKPCMPPPALVVKPDDKPYDETVFAQNDNSPALTIAAMTRAQRMQYYFDHLCFTADQRGGDGLLRDQHLITALDTLSTVTYMGQPLINLAVSNKLHFCALPHMPAGTAAQYLSSADFVVAMHNAAPQGEVLDLAHEITHAAQGRNGLLSYDYDWDIESRVRRNLAVEAAPVALEFAVAYEKKLEGDPSYWDYLGKHDAHTGYTDPENRRMFEETYNFSIALGKDRGAALRDAAHVVFERIFMSKDWRDFYLNSELNSYIEDIAAGKFVENNTIVANGFDQSKVDLAGKVGDLPSFTAGAVVPSLESVLSYNQKWVWAFEAMDIARQKQALGEGAPAVQAKVKAAKAAHNPYLDIDVDVVAARMQEARWQGRLTLTYQIMDKMLLEPKTPAPAANCPAPRAGAARAKGGIPQSHWRAF